MRQFTARPLYRPENEELRFLPECPRVLRNLPGGAAVVGWVGIQHGVGSRTGSINLLDLATGGKRERDLRNRFTVPLRPNWQTVRDFATHPGWCLQMLRHGPPRFENLAGFEGTADPRASS